MPTKFSTAAIRYGLASLLAVFGLCAAGQGQQQAQQQVQQQVLQRVQQHAPQPVALALLTPPDAPSAMEPVRPVEPIELKPLPEASGHRRFWDRENTLLFAGTVLTSAGDFVVTRQNLQGGGQELNPVARIFSGSTAGLVANFAGETAGVTGLSYFFHKTGHHRLERLAPMVNMAASGYAIGYGLRHR
jgi:hypothetical protein